MELITRLISDIEAAAPAILSLRFNMDAGSDPASKTPRKNVNNDGICFLCIKSVEPKRRIKICKHGEKTEVSQVLRNLVGEEVFLGNIVCAPCLNRAKNFDSFQSQIKDSVKFVKENNRTKRLMKDSPSSSSKKTSRF